jgi:uncharacterized membrane protein (DUF485 family)
MLNWNAKKLQNLTGTEIWLFILGRVLVAFAIGVLAAQYFPRLGAPIAVPLLIVGVILFAIAARGLWRQPAP